MACNILIADNSTSMRRVFRKVPYISNVKAGSHFEEKNGHEAAAVLRSGWLGLILIDINMQEMNGKELLVEGSEEGDALLHCGTYRCVITARVLVERNRFTQ